MGGILAALATESSLPPEAPTVGAESQATGVVYHDVNGNQKFDAGDRPLPGVRVSNGHQIVTTDGNGCYELPVDDDAILFVVKPRNWMTPLNKYNLPQFYYIHKPHGSPPTKYAGVAPTGPLPESVDFPLTPQNEPQEFKAILFGDTQPRDQKEVDWIAHDVVEGLIGTDASFGVTLGDIVFNDLEVMEPLNKTIALIGIPWYNVMGNHDINMDVETRRFANETFERIYGPSYYSFDYGPVHFLVLDNIEWAVDPATGKGGYKGGLGPEQLAFIKTDLAQIPEDQMVVLMMHIPLRSVGDRHDLYRLIEQRPFCISISAHHHVHEHHWITHEDGWQGPEPHHHIINVTVCGSWWTGAPDERGIPHTTMADGAPNGYTIIRFDGTDYALDYFAAGRSPDYQMEIEAPEVLTSSEAPETAVFANVFNGSEKWTVEMQIGDAEWSPMERTVAIDPKYQQVFDREAVLLEKAENWRKLPKPKLSTHLWRGVLPGELPPGTHPIRVRATDERGRTFHGQRIIRVE
ncbi:MAG: calcineurin-like phosphoesterase family protein [Planctomycetaceae bacterium]|nr:calcineurin-like phosphoesterase family protein [Planctomycetaceae bacterium]